jgi:hypothetical protein
MIEKLKYVEAISFIREIPTEGHNPLLIIANDYNAYYIKNTKDRLPAFDIINEFLCSYLLRLWEINTPPISAVKLDPVIFQKEMNHHHQARYYKNNIAFGSMEMPDVHEMNSFSEISSASDFKKYKRPIDLIKIALFDIWVENTDRKPSNPNILFRYVNDKISTYAIDHAFTFDAMSYEDLFVKGVSMSFNENLLQHNAVKEIIKRMLKDKNFSSSMKEYFYLCIEKSKENFNEIVDNIPDSLGFSLELQNALKAFLFNENRNNEVFTNFCSRL